MWRLKTILAPVFVLGCGSVAVAPPPPSPPTSTLPPSSRPPREIPTPNLSFDEKQTFTAHAAQDIYPVDDAVADVLSSPLQPVGSGTWHGVFRVNACAYRNDRVIVVDVYCTRTERNSFRVDVFSPSRGWVSLYAEAGAPISTVLRAGYRSFRAFSEPPAPAKLLSPPTLSMSYSELQAYQKARQGHSLPSCWGGTEALEPSRGCYKSLEPYAADFAARNEPFLASPPDAWYQLVRRMLEERKRPRRPDSSPTPQRLRARGETLARENHINLYRYHKKYVGNEEGFFAPVIATDAGGLLLVGTRVPGAYKAGSSRPLVILLDSSGKALWKKNLRRRGFVDFEGASVVGNPDGSFVVYVLSYARSGGSGTSRLIKLSPKGKVVWDWIGRGRGGTNTPHASTLKRTPKGTYLMDGHIYLEKGEAPRRWIGEVDANGKLLRDEVGGIKPAGKR